MDAGTYELRNSEGLLLTADGVGEGSSAGFREMEMNDNTLWTEHTVNGGYTAFENKLYDCLLYTSRCV